MTKSTTSVEPNHLLPRCEIDFRFHNDRYGHVIVIRRQNEVHEILKSVEGTSGDEWPPSPPLQQIHEQKLPSGNVIWGLGMSGSAHWSGSFAYQTNGTSAPCQLHAELAMRSTTPNVWPVSTYRVIDPEAKVNQATEVSFEVVTQPSHLKIYVDPERARLDWTPDHRLITIRPRTIPESGKATISWDYFLGLCPTRL